MEDRPREVLKDLVRQYGISLATDPLRTEGLLRDICGSYRREIFVLVHAIRQKVPTDLLEPRHSLSAVLLSDFLAKRLRDELSLSDEASRWAVSSWTYALGLLPVPAARQDGAAVPDTGPEHPFDPLLTARRQELAEDLQSLSLDTRMKAIRELSVHPDYGNIQLLVSALGNGNWQVRTNAFDSLQALGMAAVPALREALGDASDEIIWRVCLLIGALKAREVTGELISMLPREGIIRECAIWSLGEIGDDSASTALLCYINARDPVIRQEVECALEKIGKSGA